MHYMYRVSRLDHHSAAKKKNGIELKYSIICVAVNIESTDSSTIGVVRRSDNVPFRVAEIRGVGPYPKLLSLAKIVATVAYAADFVSETSRIELVWLSLRPPN